MDSWRLAIALVEGLDRNGRQICTVYAASCDDLGRFNDDVKWPLSSKEVEVRIALRKKKTKSAAFNDSIRSIPALGVILLMFFCLGSIAYFSGRYFGSEIVSVTVGFTVIAFGLVFEGSSVVEFVITFGVISLPVNFIFTEFPRTQIMGFDMEHNVDYNNYISPHKEV